MHFLLAVLAGSPVPGPRRLSTSNGCDLRVSTGHGSKPKWEDLSFELAQHGSRPADAAHRSPDKARPSGELAGKSGPVSLRRAPLVCFVVWCEGAGEGKDRMIWVQIQAHFAEWSFPCTCVTCACQTSLGQVWENIFNRMICGILGGGLRASGFG